MDNDKLNDVLIHIINDLREMGHEPHRLGANESWPGRMRGLNHAMALAELALEMPASRLEKKFRWLGFIQGVLWCYGCGSIDDLKQMNRGGHQ